MIDNINESSANNTHTPAEDDAHKTPSSGLTPAPFPPDVLIIIPVRDMVFFPGVVAPITIGRPASIAAAQQAVREQRQIGILMQRDAEVSEPGPGDLHLVGTVANILRYVTAPDGTHLMVCQALRRFRVRDFIPGHPYLVAHAASIEEQEISSPEIEARMMNLRIQAVEAFQLLPQAPEDLIGAIRAATSPGPLADLATAYLDAPANDKQDILETIDLIPRLEKTSRLLGERIEVLRLSQEIGRQTKAALDVRQREVVLREQMAAIQRQLGEVDGRSAEVVELRASIIAAKMPLEAEQQAQKELKRYERMPEGATEAGMVRTYLDWLVELPWHLPEDKPINIAGARLILEMDHFGLEKVKSRIIEFLSVLKLAPQGKAPILCFVGPPGVGKTSLGQSIARAMGRPFARVSLGGVHDEAEIRGHRRTYVGALPGNILQAIMKAGSRNCVLMLDEIDKVSSGIQGDPSSALLEVLDPEQNNTFRDNYLGLPFDLSRVVFITTANMLDSIPSALRDRMETISLPGYTEEEKLEIARRYLLERQRNANGLGADQFAIDDEAIGRIIRGYTGEAGVRGLEREIGKVMRNAAVRIAEGTVTQVKIGPSDLAGILGPRQYENEVALRTSVPGVATGLAWTAVGGEILFIEATRTPGKGNLILTGQLGEVMRESAQAALSLVKNRAASLGIDTGLFERSDIHIHVPAGATPKDGPSAGIAMFTSLASLLIGRKVRKDTAMTGEISLRGLVLPVGGIKEKVIAAARSGISRIILPERNRKDFEEIPASARKLLRFVWVERADEALDAALEGGATISGDGSFAQEAMPSRREPFQTALPLPIGPATGH
jgi:ATP-dependent Lon protease